MDEIEQAVKNTLHFVAGGRFVPNRVEQDTALPAIAYQSSREPVQTLSGPTGATRVKLTLIAISERFEEARSVASDVRRAMAGDPNITAMIAEEPGDQFDAETGLHLYVMVYSIWQVD